MSTVDSVRAVLDAARQYAEVLGDMDRRGVWDQTRYEIAMGDLLQAAVAAHPELRPDASDPDERPDDPDFVDRPALARTHRSGTRAL